MLLKYLRQLWDWLTEPKFVAREPSHRRHAQLLATLLVTLLPLGLLVEALPALFAHRSPLVDADYYTLLAATLFWSLAYYLTRTGRYRIATLLSVGLAILVIFILAINDVEPADLNSVLLPLLLSSVVLPMRGTAFFVIVALVGMLLTPLIQPQMALLQILVRPFTFTFIGASLILLTVRHRDLLEQDRRFVLAESEARYRSLLETTFEGIAILEQGVIRDANSGLAAMFGYPFSMLIGLPISALLSGETNALSMQKPIIDIDSEHPYEARGRKQDGTLLHLEMVDKTLKEQGRIVQVVAMRDISERKQAEEALRYAQKLDSMGLLAGGIAHDFNNLLSAILSQNSVALHKLPTESSARIHLEKALKSTARAAELTGQLLAYAGRHHTEHTLVDLNQLIQENYDLLAAVLPRKGWLKLQLGTQLPGIEVDRSQVQQVLMNLVINAAEALLPEQGGVTVATFHNAAPDHLPGKRFIGPPTLSSGEYVCLEVRDTGIGMSEETLSQIFDPFYSTKPKGHGLGLSAALGIIRMHQAALQVQSEIGRGTMFAVFFPASPKLLPAVATPPAALAVERKLTGCILVIDDEEPVREAVIDILSMTGLRVLTATNGQEGVTLYAAHHTEINAVVLDVQMPVLNGEETFKLLCQYNPAVRVIFSSGYTATDAVRTLVEEGMATYLSKPYNQVDLINKLQAVLS